MLTDGQEDGGASVPRDAGVCVLKRDNYRPRERKGGREREKYTWRLHHHSGEGADTGVSWNKVKLTGRPLSTLFEK